ncbi:MAG: CDP-diacylglycerol--glycerol-3-phosphate 3-phosphatidyltransferase [Coriobacteriia bacterium]|nr:CDP-diacylglycerol--glycerol-3-phosphate 3-phosphatidyltransferase [Coriobacteriia bacterium]
MSNTKSSQNIWTVANIVTMVRIAFIPVFMVLLLAPWEKLAFVSSWAADYKPLVAALVFSILSATDWVDGYLARSRNEVTTFGKFIDPIADKILVMAALLGLIELGDLPSWIALIIVVREFLVSGLRMVAASEGLVIAASWIGKWKTASTLVAIILFLVKASPALQNHAAFYQFIEVLAWILMILAVALTIISMIDYFMKSSKVLYK